MHAATVRPGSRSSDRIDGDAAAAGELSDGGNASGSDSDEFTDDEELGGRSLLGADRSKEATSAPSAAAPGSTRSSRSSSRRRSSQRSSDVRARPPIPGGEVGSVAPFQPKDTTGEGCCVRWLGAGSGVLWLFTICQLLIFYDRGMVAGFLPAIQRDLGEIHTADPMLPGGAAGSVGGAAGLHHQTEMLSDSAMGLLGSGFIFGYMLACPLFAFFSKTYSPYKLMAVGLFLWCVAVMLCGLTNNFITLLGARILTGVGEASFAGLAPTCIDDVAPLRHRTIWLSFFFSGVPIGSALGYIAGGFFSSQWGPGWHWGFITECLLMIPVLIVVFLWPNHVEQMEAAREAEEEIEAQRLAARRTRTRKASWARPRAKPEDAAQQQPSVDPTAAAAGCDQSNPTSPLDSVPPLPSTSVPVRPAVAAISMPFARSISTPALKRLEDAQQQEAFFEAGDGGATEVQAPTDERKSVPPSPSARGVSTGAPVVLTLSVPSSPLIRSLSGGTSASTTRSSRIRGEGYIIRPDPRNPFHAPGTTNRGYSERQYVVATPKAGGWVDEEADADPNARLMGELPSPTSFNPHYTAQQLTVGREDELFVTDVATLLTDGVYIVVVLGYAALAFVIGALSFWAPVDFSKTLHISISRSTQIIGLITFCCGLGGTFFGGWCLDARGSGKGIFAVIRALELCVLFVSLSIVFALGAVLTMDLTTSMICLALADFFLFGTGAPVNAALLSVAPKNMRSLAMAMSILLMHALGDLPSPFLMGYITDQVSSIRLALVILCLWLLWTVAFWVLGVALARRRAEAFKRRLREEMSRPVGERSALLVRRGSTGQFYSGASGGGRRTLRSDEHQQHSLSQQPSVTHSVPRPVRAPMHSSGPTTPIASYQSAGRSRTPTYRRDSVSPSPARALYTPTPLDSAIAPSSIVAVPIFDQSGVIVGYAQAPSQPYEAQHGESKTPSAIRPTTPLTGSRRASTADAAAGHARAGTSEFDHALM